MSHGFKAIFSLIGLAAVTASVIAFPAPKAPPAPTKGYPAVAAIFKKECVGCHSGPDAAAKFDVSSYAKVMRASKNGKMVVPGKPDKSPLIAYLKGAKKPAMPMGSNGLKAADLKVVSDWIAKGAKNK